MKRIALAALGLSALFACAAPAAAQQATFSRAPAGYAPEYAPVTVPATSTPLTGTFAAAGTSPAFTPQLGRAITVTLSGTWTGSIQLLRSRDGGVTKLPITYSDGTVKGVWTTNVNAIVTVKTVAGATYYLQAATGFTGSAAYTVEN